MIMYNIPSVQNQTYSIVNKNVNSKLFHHAVLEGSMDELIYEKLLEQV